MVYEKLSIEELKNCKYPNLIAEFQESGYSICTLADHMGLGAHRREDDMEVWEKLSGIRELLATEALGLATLFGTSLDYLYSDELTVADGKTCAFYRHYETNKRIQEDIERMNLCDSIRRELKKNPRLMELFKEILSMSNKELDEFIARINGYQKQKEV